MNTIQLDVRFETPLESVMPELAVGVVVDGALLAAESSVDVVALYDSAQESGEYFIWTCSCGVAGCAGIYQGVQIAHQQDSVVWQVPQVPFEQAARFEFARAAYVAAIMSGLREYVSYLKSYGAAGIAFEAAPDWQLEELLAKMASR